MVGGVLGAIATLAVVLVISFAAAGPNSKHGCIYATVPADTGAEQINQCGTAARDTCQSVAQPGAYTQQAERVITAECRKAGLPVGAG
jgi:hypothetical protein